MVIFDERGEIKDRFSSSKYGARGMQSLDFEDIDDVCQLIRREQYPDGRFSDDECAVWEIITRELGIDTSHWL